MEGMRNIIMGITYRISPFLEWGIIIFFQTILVSF